MENHAHIKFQLKIKQTNISNLSSEDMDTIMYEIIKLIGSEKNALLEIETILKIYNDGKNELPQSKTLEGAPSKLVFSSDSLIKPFMEQASSDKGFNIHCSEKMGPFPEDTY
ncbi:MAG: hypothetical protein FWE27_02680 [Defluviitaleaceae bacterium]|nr:hypothetical protein [Defluviitaleaceae bacterium]